MPIFRMIIHGRGRFTLGVDDDGKVFKADGFYATRRCWAKSELAATERGMMNLRHEWTHGVSASMDPDHSLSMTVDKVWRVGILDIWRGSNRGHTFYTDDEVTS